MSRKQSNEEMHKLWDKNCGCSDKWSQEGREEYVFQ